MVDDIDDLRRRQAGVDGDQHATGLKHAEVSQQQRLGVEREECDAVASLETRAAECGGKAPRAGTEFCPGVGSGAVHDGEP